MNTEAETKSSRRVAVWTAQRIARFCRWRCLPLLGACTLLMTVMVPGARAEGDLPQSGAQPGATNPVGASDTNIFADDELNIWGVNRAALSATYFYGDPQQDDLKVWGFDLDASPIPLSYSRPFYPITYDYNYKIMAMARGRVSDPYEDQTVLVGWDVLGSELIVDLRASSGAASSVQSTYLTVGSVGTLTYGVGVDVAVGDLDGVVDEDGYLHDEIAVAVAHFAPTGGHFISLFVYDYDLNVLASHTISSLSSYTAVTFGDFDGDKNLEIALAGSDKGQPFTLTLLRLVEDSGTYTLTAGPTFSTSTSFATVDVCAGDFAGIGREQVAAVLGAQKESDANHNYNVYIFEGDNDLNLQQKVLIPAGSGANAHDFRIASGLFKYDPGNGYDFGRRQFVTANLSNISGGPNVVTYIWEVDSSYNHSIIGGYEYDTSGYRHAAKLDIAVGNFVGHGVEGDQTDPTMGYAFTCLFTTSDATDDPTKVRQEVRIVDVAPYGPGPYEGLLEATPVWSYDWPTGAGFGIYEPFAPAVDYDGDSWRLGDPYHLVVSGMQTVDNLIQEPPKHVDYLPVNPDEPGEEWEVFNIGGFDAFKVSLEDKTGKTVQTMHKDMSSWDIGGGANLDLKASMSEGFMGLAKLEAGVDASVKLNYTHESTSKTTDTAYDEGSLDWDDSTTRDDELNLRLQDLDIWRYPIIGFMTEDDSNPVGFYEITLPGPSSPFHIAGNTKDWYHPLHENHNVLSYPQVISGTTTWKPPDVGSFEIPGVDEDGNPTTTTVTDTLNEPVTYAWDGNEHSWGLDYSSKAGNEVAKSFNNTLSENAELSASVSVRVLEERFEASGGLNFNNKNSWGESQTGSTETSDSTGLTLTIPAGPEREKGYSFTTAVYISSQGGTLKVAHAVDLSQVQDWWKQQYNRKPDPALNLPSKFNWHEPYGEYRVEYWTLKQLDDPTDMTRKEMHGFFMKQNEPDPVTGDYELFPGMPVDGDIVRLCARVYNYSLTKPTGSFDASFYYYLWDSEEARQIADPVLIGKVTDIVLDGVQTANGTSSAEVCVPWDTAGLSHVAQASYGYRFIVNLDEDNRVNETHELYEYDEDGNIEGEALGGNNSGEWPWLNVITVGTPEQSAEAVWLRREGRVVASESATDFSLPINALALKAGQQIQSGEGVRVTRGERVHVRVQIHSETQHLDPLWLVVWDGDPQQGAEVISLERVRGLAEGDNFVWAEWTPTSSGEYTVRALALSSVLEANREDSKASMRASVTESLEGGGGGEGDGCSVIGAQAPPRKRVSANPVLLGLLIAAVMIVKRRSSRGGNRSS